MAASVFDKLLAFSFRGIQAPYTSFTEDGGQSLAEHLHADRDGGRQEGTGRNPYSWQFKLAFINGIARASNEAWNDGLYPQEFNRMVEACEDRSTGELQHPRRGIVKVKVATWHSELNHDDRGGEYLTIVFKETLEGDDTTAAASDFTSFREAALDLDAQLGSLKPPIKLAPQGQSIGDFVSDVSSFVSGPKNYDPAVTSKMTAMVANATSIVDRFSSAGRPLTERYRLSPYGHTLPEDFENLPAQIDPSTGVAIAAAEIGNSSARIVNLGNRIVAALLRLQAQAQAKDEAIGVKIVDAAGTLAVIGRRYRNTAEEMLALNQHLIGKPVVERGALVRYYKRDAA